jgi:hypothetical protein
MPSISFLIPAYNEEATIADVAERALKILRSLGENFEIIFLDYLYYFLIHMDLAFILKIVQMI